MFSKNFDSYEYATQSWKHFLMSRLLSFCSDFCWTLFLLLVFFLAVYIRPI